MKKSVSQFFLFTVLVLGTFIIGGRAFAVYEINSEALQIEQADEHNQHRRVLTNKPIELYGPFQEKTFFYEVRSPIKQSENEIVLHLKHSELLIEPSAVTVSIDEETVKSILLTKYQLTNRIVIPLSGKSLSTGFHSITVAFNGVIKDGVCVDQETPGNWMTIRIDSSIKLNESQADDASLRDFPTQFTANAEHPVAIIIPQKASLETRNIAATLGAFLAGKSADGDYISIVKESKIDQLSGSFILVGGKDEFQSEPMKKVIIDSKITIPLEGMQLSRHRVKGKGGSVEALFILADSPKEIESRLGILVQDSYSKQLSGQQMTITTTPKAIQSQGVVTFKKFGIGNLTFDRSMRESETYFGYAPPNFDGNPILNLLLRRSETLKRHVDDAENSLLAEEVEMVVHVNDVPYAIDLRSLVEEEDGLYSIQIPIEERTFKKNHSMSLRLEVNGLRRKNPCLSNNENRWVYVSEDSHFTFQKTESTNEKTLASYPYPFNNPTDQTKIVLPVGQEVSDQELLLLYQSLAAFGNASIMGLMNGDAFDEKIASKSHLIFIGDVAKQPALENQKDELIVKYDNGLPDFHSFGFLKEAVHHYAWMQSNPWSKDEHTMIVMNSLVENEKQKIVYRDFLELLTGLEEDSSVAVQTSERQLYTNADQFMRSTSTVKSSTTPSESSQVMIKWWFIGLIGIIFFALFVYVLTIRKKKKDSRDM